MSIAIEPVLAAFDAASLEATSFRFAGGTRIALELDEFRVSRDLDFVCADAHPRLRRAPVPRALEGLRRDIDA